MKYDIDIIGGPRHGTTWHGKPDAYLDIYSKDRKPVRYTALRFPVEPGSKELVTVYMAPNLKPIDVMAIWREEQMFRTEKNRKPLTEEEQKVARLAQNLIDASAEEIFGEGEEAFIQMIESMQKRLRETPHFEGRMKLIVLLGCKITDIKESMTAQPELLNTTDAKEPTPAKCASESGGGASGAPARKALTPEESARSMGAIQTPTDPDDEEW